MSENTVNAFIGRQEFAKQYKSELLDTEKCKVLLEKLLEQKSLIKAQLDEGNKESIVVKYLDNSKEKLFETREILQKSSSLSDENDSIAEKFAEIQKRVQELVENLHFVQTKVQYLTIIKHIENFSNNLVYEFQSKDDERCVTLYLNICEVYRGLNSCSQATILKNYIRENIVYWHEILKAKLAQDLDEVLKAIKWPFVSANFSLITPSQTNIQKLQIVVEYMLEIDLPEDMCETTSQSGILSDFKPLCLPMNYLLMPLRQRFIYHFYGTRQTNRVDKPEWYFTQILSWVRDHIDFIEKWIQPIIDKLGLHHIDAKVELMRGLVQLAVEKLNSEIPNFRYDDFTFSHSIDESLGFDKELRETYFYSPSQPRVLSVLTQGTIFNQWLKMEKKFALEKMDSILNEGAFELLSNDETEHKIPICADTFITLLQTITERYESLPQPGHRLQFLELQIELLENFRIRLQQLVNVEMGDLIDSKVPMIANSIFYVENVLLDWGSMIHFLGLFYYKTQLKNLEENSESFQDYNQSPDIEFESETVFADTLSLYQHMRKDLLCTLSEQAIHQAKSRSRIYREERWSSMPSSKDPRTLSLTPSACPMFEVLGKRLHQLQKSLTTKLFTIVWRFIAEELDNYLFEHLVLDNRFNDGGANQLKFDTTRNLFPLFSQFSEKPENYFLRMKESCELLNISKGTALLLRETLVALEGATGVEDRRPQALKEVGVFYFTPQMSVTILNRRNDITVNRNSTF